MSWQRYDPDAPRHGDPQLTLYRNLNGYLNAPADWQWFRDAAEVDVHVDPDRELIALEPQPEGEGYLTLARENDYGADVSFKPPLEHELGFDTEMLDGSLHVPLEWDDEHGWLVVDLSGLRDAGDADEQANEDDGTRWCGKCGDDFVSARGVEIHDGKADGHDGPADIREEPPDLDDSDESESDPVEDSNPTVEDDVDDETEVPDPEDTHSPETVRDVAASVDTLSELADKLELSFGEARLQARQAGVLTEVRDDVNRMGVPN